MRKYHEKGIFTIKQLSHVYKPRRSRKKAKRQVRHSLELQALAIRTGKVHVEHLPELPRGPVELFVDLEGVPDRDEYYLAGLLVCRGEEAEYEPSGRTTRQERPRCGRPWSRGWRRSPTPRSTTTAATRRRHSPRWRRRHGKGKDLVKRLVNVASSVYGKVYFPVRSNGLKSLGQVPWGGMDRPAGVGTAKPGLAAQVGGDAGRAGQGSPCSQYNREDCEAVRLLVDRLDQIRRDAASDPTIEFASRPKRYATETGKAVHGQFERILEFSGRGLGGSGNPSPSEKQQAKGEPKTRGGQKGHQMLPAGSFRRKSAGLFAYRPSDGVPRATASCVQTSRSGRADNHRPRFHAQRLPEDGHHVTDTREQGLLLRSATGTTSRPP